MKHYSTRSHWSGREWVITLSCGTTIVATMTLDEWSELGINALLVEDAARQAAHEARLQAAETGMVSALPAVKRH
jgi:hypothetical protein